MLLAAKLWFNAGCVNTDIRVSHQNQHKLQGVVITPSSFWGTWCYRHNFLVIGVIKVNPVSFLGEFDFIEVKSMKMTFNRNCKILQKNRNFSPQIRKKKFQIIELGVIKVIPAPISSTGGALYKATQFEG